MKFSDWTTNPELEGDSILQDAESFGIRIAQDGAAVIVLHHPERGLLFLVVPPSEIQFLAQALLDAPGSPTPSVTRRARRAERSQKRRAARKGSR